MSALVWVADDGDGHARSKPNRGGPERGRMPCAPSDRRPSHTHYSAPNPNRHSEFIEESIDRWRARTSTDSSTTLIAPLGMTADMKGHSELVEHPFSWSCRLRAPLTAPLRTAVPHRHLSISGLADRLLDVAGMPRMIQRKHGRIARHVFDRHLPGRAGCSRDLGTASRSSATPRPAPTTPRLSGERVDRPSSYGSVRIDQVFLTNRGGRRRRARSTPSAVPRWRHQ